MSGIEIRSHPVVGRHASSELGGHGLLPHQPGTFCRRFRGKAYTPTDRSYQVELYGLPRSNKCHSGCARQRRTTEADEEHRRAVAQGEPR